MSGETTNRSNGVLYKAIKIFSNAIKKGILIRESIEIGVSLGERQVFCLFNIFTHHSKFLHNRFVCVSNILNLPCFVLMWQNIMDRLRRHKSACSAHNEGWHHSTSYWPISKYSSQTYWNVLRWRLKYSLLESAIIPHNWNYVCFISAHISSRTPH